MPVGAGFTNGWFLFAHLPGQGNQHDWRCPAKTLGAAIGGCNQAVPRGQNKTAATVDRDGGWERGKLFAAAEKEQAQAAHASQGQRGRFGSRGYFRKAWIYFRDFGIEVHIIPVIS